MMVYALNEDQRKLAEHMITTLGDDTKVKKRLTDWEKIFLISVTEQFKFKQDLSKRQFEILEGIYAEKTV